MELTRIVSDRADRSRSSANDKLTSKHKEEKFLPSQITTSYLNDKGEVKSLEFVYDNANRLVSEICSTFERGKLIERNTFNLVYNSNGLLDRYTVKWEEIGMDEVIYEEDSVTEFSYDGSKVIADHKALGNKNILTLDANKRILKNEHVSEYYSKCDTYTYDKVGNIVRKETTNSGSNALEESKRTGYAYDKKNGIFKNLNVAQWVLILMESEYDKLLINNLVEASSCFSSYKEVTQYEYTKGGYPKSYTSKRVFENSNEGEEIIASTLVEYVER